MKRRWLAALGTMTCLSVSLPAVAAESDRSVLLGLTSWFAASPTWNAHYMVSLTVPFGSTPWLLMTDFVPTLGSGHLDAGYRFDLGPVTLTPGLGYRFFGAATGTASADARNFEIGPEVRLGAAMPLTSWLSLWAGIGYAPFMANPYGGAPGSYLDGNLALQATYERVSFSLGYGGLLFNGGQAGNPGGNLSMGGPTVGILTRF